MAVTRKGTGRHQVPAESSMAGILALLVEAREARIKENEEKEAPKTEALLWAAGLSVEDIAAITRKNGGAVRKAIQRGRGA